MAVSAIDISQSLEQEGVFFAGAVVPPFGAKPEAAIEELDEQIDKLRTGPITDRELLKAKNRALKSIVLQTLTIEGKASALGEAAVLEGNPARANDILADVRRVTIDDLKRVARTYLVPERQIKVLIPSTGMAAGPKKNPEEDAPITAEPETQAPRPGRPGVARPQGFFPAPPLAAPLAVEPPPLVHTTHTLDNGLKVLIVPNHEVPFVGATLGLLSGAWTETKPGTVSMTLDMITKGTKHHDEAQLADELGTYAISLSGTGGMDSSTVSANCLTEELERALGLLGEVVREPTFPEADFDDTRTQTLTGLRVSSRAPAYVARRELRRKMYGEHPYARTATGEIKDVEALKLDDLPAWWNKFARPDAAVLILSGDIDDKRGLALAEKIFGDWKVEGDKPEIKLPEPPAAGPTGIVLVDRPDVTQSQIYTGQLGITRHDPRYAASRVIDGYFGGAFSSRLNESIRVKKGLTYGANGGFHAQRFAGDFTVHTFSKTESTAEALAAVFDEIKRLKSKPPTTDELRKTKAYLVGSFPMDRETPLQMASELWLLAVNNLPESYFDEELRSVVQADEAACMDLIENVVRPDETVVVVVGQADELKAGLEKIAPVTVIDAKE